MLKSKIRGATGSGYALTVGLISIVALGAVTGTGNSVIELFGGVGDTLIEVTAADLTITPGAASGMNITSGPVPATSSSVQFLVKNIGNSPTAALTASLINEIDFVIDSDGCSGIQLGSQSSCAVTVSMTAVANGSYSGTLRVGGGAKFVEAPLSGTASGLDPASISVDQPSVSGMDVTGPGSPATGSPVTLTFTNDGEITSGTLTTANDNATNFAISSDTCNGNTLAGGATCSMQVTPQSSNGGALTASISVGDGQSSAAASLSGTASGFALFGFTSHTFSNCGVSGRTGPSLSQCRSAYSTSWDEDNANFTMGNQGYQIWTVPETGNYQITVAGARGGMGDSNNANYRGDGRIIRATYALTEGQQLTIVVGQMGQDRHNVEHYGGGGGGGTFVALGSNAATATIMMVGGGGGGAPDGDTWGYQAPSNGHNDGLTFNYGDTSRSVGGYRGDGASVSVTGYSQYTTGQPGYNALSFRDGLRGGLNSSCYSTFGGFGGGGTPHCHNGGGGGGYSGGAGGNWADDAGEGGGSYISGTGTSTNMDIGLNASHGYVTIQKL